MFWSYTDLCDGVIHLKVNKQFPLEMEQPRKSVLHQDSVAEQCSQDEVDQVAFDQDELNDLLDKGATTIYLCGDTFTIPLSKTGICYIGVNQPVVVIDATEPVVFAERDIQLKNVRFDEAYEAVHRAVDQRRTSPDSSSEYLEFGPYRSNSFLSFMLSAEDRREAERCYNLLAFELKIPKYDIDRDTAEIRKQLTDAGLPGLAKDFLNRL